MPLKIGVMGSVAGKNATPILKARARRIGQEIVRHDCILITGGSSGLPYEATLGAHKVGGLCIAISPASTLTEHKEKFSLPTAHQILIFTGFGLKGRNVISIRTCDAVIFIGGRMGTLNEFTNAYGEGKVIGVLTSTGGISDEFKKIVQRSRNSSKAKIVYESDPKILVQKVVQNLSK